MQWHILVVLLASSFYVTDSSKILCLFPHVGKSHFIMAEALLKGLAARGHQVTVISHFPQKTPIPNYKDISLVGSMPEYVNNIPLDKVATGYVHSTISLLANLATENCKNTMEFPAMKRFIATNEKFDLIITEIFNTDCLLGYVYKQKTPFISLSSSVLMPWAHARFANPDNPAYMGNHFLYHGDQMNLKERVINTLFEEGLKWVYYFMFERPAYQVANKYFGPYLPSLSEIAKNTSLLLVNSHFSLNQPRPFVPNIVEVGGIHMQPLTNKLPKDLKDYLDGAKHGVIYFSFGSTARAETFPKEKRDAFIQAFSELPQRILWKWEGDTLPGQPKNVKIVRWLPQVEVLAHPNVKVFVTHGGLMGSIEAVYTGVPMVGVPLFGDQFHNVRCAELEGIAVMLNYQTISKGTVLKALKTVLDNPSYKENALRVRKAYNDRPLSALDTAVYWTEYVIRHGGARHMRSAAVKLSWYQYLLLDVIAVLLLGALAILAVLKFIVKKLLSLCRRSKNEQKTKAKKS